jgi:hypothetical protein
MAKASRKHFGAGVRGKGAGVGAQTDVPKDKLTESMVLSNRDKKRHSDERGLDSREIKNEQFQDHAGNRLSDD